MLSLQSLRVVYGQAVAVGSVSIDIADNSWTLILGPNGAGKTSLLRAAMGLAPHGGKVSLDQVDLTRLPAWERQRHGLGIVPEGRQLFPEMTVDENLRVGGYSCTAATVRRGMEGAYAQFTRLAERRNQLASTLSGGEQQMLALARALIAEPKILLVDEISWGLSPILVKQVFEHLKGLHKSGVALLQVEQNAHEALKYADVAHVMSAGDITLSGAAGVIATNPLVIESYVGS